MNRPWVLLSLVMCSTAAGLMGTDLVLPAVPALPEALGGTAASAQLVLAAYVGGTCIGLLAFGAWSARFSTHRLFLASMASTAVLSLACAAAASIESLILLRALQGAAASAPAVFAPALIRALLPPDRAVRALGLVGSVESLAPALAPIAGAALLMVGGWALSFQLLAALTAALAVATVVLGPLPQASRRDEGSYGKLLRDPVFLRYASTQALVLGGLLIFVLGMPAVFVRVFGGSVSDFIMMQIAGITTYVVTANLSSRIAARYGAETIISVGTALAATGALAQLGYALTGGRWAVVVAACFVPLNAGLGLRGPPGFYRAVVAAQGDDARGAALVVLFILAVTALGTAAVSPWIASGTVPLAALTLGLELAAVLCLAVLPRMSERGTPNVPAIKAVPASSIVERP